MAVTVITITASRKQVVDFSYPYSMDQFGFTAHKPGFLPQWQSLLWPLDITTWLAILITLILFPVALYAILVLSKKLLNRRYVDVSFIYIVVNVVGQFLRSGSRLKFHSDQRGKMLLSLWSLMTFILTTGKLELHIM